MMIRTMKLPIFMLAASAALLTAQSLRQPNVEFEMMSWSEVRQALQDGKVNAIVYNGGTEQRGPQNVNGGHNLMARETARAIALKLGNAIVAPILNYSPNEADPKLPGTIGLTGEIFAAINERISEQLLKNGFKNVFLMGDHGGGQKELEEVAKKLDAKYAPEGKHVYFCGEMYEKAQNDYWKWLADNKYPSYGHASIMDTSEMLYLSTLNGDDKGWVRKDLIKSAVGDAVRQPGERRDPNAPRINNGITGDARPSTPELGKKIFDMKVDYAVRQIKQYLGTH
jgi:creatinine amidohydrolase/Fe(II)-dependent formamide hydrolase-like protein